jgi:hypothetical protein
MIDHEILAGREKIAGQHDAVAAEHPAAVSAVILDR